MSIVFDQLTLPAIQAAIAAATPVWASVNDAYAAGDHWQGGRGWVGPMPPAMDLESLMVIAEIQKAFVSKNVIREVVKRHVSGVIGREPAWGLTVTRPLKTGKQPTRAEQVLIDEAEAALTTWWDERGMLKLLQEFARPLVRNGRATLRLFIPSGLLINGAVPPGDLVTSLSRIYVQVPAPAQSLVITDATTQQQASVYLYQEGQQTYAELSYVDMASGHTVLRIIGSDATSTGVRLDLGKRLFLQEARVEALVTEQVRQLQNHLNLARTMEGRNVVQGGFLERVVLNGQMPGDYVDDPTAPPDGAGRRRRFVSKPMRFGASRTNFINGQAVRDEQGRITSYTPASIVYRDPVPVDTFEMTVDSVYRAILEETQQVHSLIAGDATASGESRKQARGDFAQSLNLTKPEVDRMVRWLLETALSLAAIFAGTPGRYIGLRASSDCRVDTGPLTDGEQTQIITQVDKEMLSHETGMSRLGVEDVDAEQARIDTERAARQARAQQLAAATQPAATNDQPPTDPKQPTTGTKPPTPPSPAGQGSSATPQGGS